MLAAETVQAPTAIRPQAGPQERFLASPSDIAVFGGARGPGKSWALLAEPLRHVHLPKFSAVIFRRTYPEIMPARGLWQASWEFYPALGGEPRQTSLEWIFPSGARIKFAHLQLDTDRYAWKGAEIALLELDQAEQFTEDQFWFLLTANRSVSGVRPYVRLGCNPVLADDPVGGWLHRLLAWWLDEATGEPRWDRAGLIRWFVRRGEELAWADDPMAFPGEGPKSLTFIPGRLEDNPVLMQADPSYAATLRALPYVERLRAFGNWTVRPTAGKVFNRAWFPVVEAAPAEAVRVRAWDKAGTLGGGDYSAGVRMAAHAGVFYVEHVIRGQWSSQQRNLVMRQTAEYDGAAIPIHVEQEGGSGGKESAEISVRELAGWMVRAEPVTGDKLTRMGPLAAQAEAGNVRLVRGQWNEDFLAELHGVPEGAHDDQADAAAMAFNKLTLRGEPLRFFGAATPTEEERAEQAERQRAIGQQALDAGIRAKGAWFPGDAR